MLVLINSVITCMKIGKPYAGDLFHRHSSTMLVLINSVITCMKIGKPYAGDLFHLIAAVI